MAFATTCARMWLTRTTKPFTFGREYDQCLPYQELDELGLYVHIPFCRTLCSFCPYCKVPYEQALAEKYLAALLKEIELVGRQSLGRQRATSLYFGGGSPALLAPHLGSIIEALKGYFTITDGIGVELHPADVTPETLTLLREAGVTKLSIGVQSFQPAFLRALGRDAAPISAMTQALAQAPFPTVSMDFIFALPGQTFDDIRRDIEQAAACGANHFALYPFIDFGCTSSTMQALDKGAKRRLLAAVSAYCAKQGYSRDSIWTWALAPGHGYSSMTRDHYLGFGCSAATLLGDQFKINTFSIPAYIDRVQQGLLPTALTLHFTRRQRMVYYLFWTAYTMDIDPAGFQALFHTPLNRAFGLEIAAALALGWLTRTADGYRLTDRGAFLFHYFEGFYTLSYIDKMWGVLRNQAFPEGLTL